MDIDLARTFLEIVRTGSFIEAGKRLHVSQTTITARVRNLEGQLGCRLFTRNRAGASTTLDGERFIPHASQLVNTWETAKRELPLPKGASTLLTIGGETSLWDPLMLDWLASLRNQHGETAIRVDISGQKNLHKKVAEGEIDAALVHQPDYWPGIQVEQLLEEKLIKVASAKGREPYIYVDWGKDFCRQHDAALPEFAKANVSTNLGPLALEFLATQSGSGYFRTRAVQPYLEQGLIVRETNAPEFSYPVYLIYSRERDSKLLQLAIANLKQLAHVK